MAAALLAILSDNSPLKPLYDALLATPVQVRIGALELAKPLLLWVNDGLMAVFFFLPLLLVFVVSGSVMAVAHGALYHKQEPITDVLGMVGALEPIAEPLAGQAELRFNDGKVDPFGHFVTGAFATLLATPCSAPFLGTAIGFALGRGPVEIFAIFAALGVGMALPYLVVAAFPTLATSLPKPGRWMIWLRVLMGLALAGTAIWLITVLATVSGPLAAAAVASLMILLAPLIWLMHAGRTRSPTR